MNYRTRNRKPDIGRVDPWMLVVTLLLAGCGVAMIYSASFARAAVEQGHALYFLKRQLVWVVVGTLIMLLVGKINYRSLNSPFVVFGLSGLTLMLLVAVLFGPRIANTHRWLALGPVHLQPAELAKLTVVILLAYMTVMLREDVRSLKQGVLPIVAIPLIYVGLIAIQPDLGSCIVIGALLIAMLYTAGTRLQYIFATGAVGLVGVAGAIAVAPWRLDRIRIWIDPWRDAQGTGYQIIQSWIAIGSGGLFGRGLGEGRQKLFFLPAPHNDFILSTVGEEVGMVGLWIVLALFAFMLYRAFRAAFYAPDSFGKMLGFGLATLLALQVTINAMVVTGLLPNKGLALPFLSYGGSSALLNFAAVGLLLAISRQVDPERATSRDETRAAVGLGEVAR